MPEEPDPELLRRFVHGDADAFESLFQRFQADVFRWILRIVREPAAAEDALIEAFWRAHRGRARFDPSRSFGAWMRTVATNVARDHLKDTCRRVRSSAADERIAAAASPDEGVRQCIALAFRRLPPRLQVVATLALIEERPYAEIADALDVPVGTVKSRVFRATRALRIELARLGIQP